MRWFHRTLVGAVAGSLAGLAAAQEPPTRPAVVTLGRPTPIAPADVPTTTGIVRAFVPIGPATPAIQKTTYWPDRPSSVVRGAMPSLGDEPRALFPPKTLPLLEEMNLPAPTLPPITPTGSGSTQPVPPAPPSKDEPKIIEVDKDGKITVVPEPPKLAGPAKAPRDKDGKITVVPEPPKLSAPAKAAREPAPIMQDGERILDGGMVFDDAYGNDRRFYAQGEYLLWWTRGFRLPPLVVTDSANTPLDTRGLLGNGTTQLLYGNNTTSQGPNSGARLTLGYSCDPCDWCVFEGSFFFLGRKSETAAFDSNQFPVLGRPFFDLNDGIPSRELTTSPQGSGIFAATGSIRVDSTSTLFGGEANLRSALWYGCDYKITGLLGFRYLDLNESVRISENSLVLTNIPFTPPDVPVNAGDQVRIFDQFGTRNRFYGGQVGAAAEMRRGPWTMEGRFKLGFGVTQQVVTIDGAQQIVSPNGRVQNFPGGLYALPSNMGTRSQNQFGFVPEIGVKLGYNLTENIRVFVGYDFLYWSSVLRPGDQIDQVIDLNQVPQSGRPYPQANQVRPVVPFRTSSYWAQGVNAGVEFRY